MVSLFKLQCNIAIKWHRAQLRCIQFKYYHLNFNSFLLSIIYLCCKHLIPRFIIGIVWYFVDSGSIQILSHKNNNCLRKGLTKRTCELRICDAMDLLLWVMYLLFHNRVTKYHVILPTIWHSLFVILSWWLVVFQSRSICLLHINVWRLNKWNIEMSEYTMMSVIHNDETIALIIVWCHYN